MIETTSQKFETFLTVKDSPVLVDSYFLVAVPGAKVEGRGPTEEEAVNHYVSILLRDSGVDNTSELFTQIAGLVLAGIREGKGKDSVVAVAKAAKRSTVTKR